MNKLERFWQDFLNETKRHQDTKYCDAYHFERTEYWANELLRLVLIGQKQATASSYQAFIVENSPLPKVGDLNIVTDFFGNPKGVVETTYVSHLFIAEHI